MKKIFKYIMFLTIGVLAAACTYDESELSGQIDDINVRIEKLKGDVEVLNTQLGSLNEIAKGNPITKVTKDSDGKYVITYLNDQNEEKTIVLATMDQMVKVPMLGVKQESETSPYIPSNQLVVTLFPFILSFQTSSERTRILIFTS